MRRIWTTVLAVATLVLAGMAVAPAAAEAKEVTATGTWAGATYTVYDDGSATVTGKFTKIAPGQWPSELRQCTSLDVSGVDVSVVTNMNYMFSGTGVSSNYTTVRIYGFDTWDVSHVQYMTGMFSALYALESVEGIANWDVSNVTDMRNMFQFCDSLRSLDLSGWDMTAVFENAHKPDATHTTYVGLSGLFQSTYEYSKSFGFSSSIEKPKLSAIRLGPKCHLNGCDLVDPDATDTYTGKWIRADGQYGPLTAEELMSGYTADMAGLWVWEGTPITCNLDGNGGSGSMTPVTFGITGTNAIPACAYYRSGYSFKEWNTKADGTGHVYQPGSTYAGTFYNEAMGRAAQAGDTITLYAIWEKEAAKVTGGTGEFDVTLHAGEQVTIEGLPAGSTYVVTETPVPGGWSLVQQQGTTGVITPGH